MVQYEYKTVEIKDDEFFLEELNRHGNEGWEAWYMQQKVYEQFQDLGTIRASVTPHYYQKVQFRKPNHQ